MKYVNPKIPEGINVSNQHPLRELALLLGGILALLGSILLILSLTADLIAVRIPFKYELELIQNFPIPEGKDSDIENYMQSLADRLALAQELPDDIPITVHYVDDSTINAFATLGGHIILFRGLVENVASENALSMVISHEIAHIKHRHPIRALGRGVVVGLAMAAIFNVSGNNAAGSLLGNTGLLTALSFNRAQEIAADETALIALERVYGSVSGAETLFELLLEAEKGNFIKSPEFFSTHPDTLNRIKNIRATALKAGWATNKPLEPLPEFFSKNHPAVPGDN